MFFYDYDKTSKKILEKYGNFKIIKMYLVREPIKNFFLYLMNLVTFYKYNKIILNSKKYFPYHTYILLVINTENNIKKIISIEKNNTININEYFNVNNEQNFNSINIVENKYSINDMLNITKKRIGVKKFYNWNINKNNCQKFAKELIITMNAKKNKKYIFQDKIMKELNPSELTLYIVNCIVIFSNIFIKIFTSFV
jgi:hypothetical protein